MTDYQAALPRTVIARRRLAPMRFLYIVRRNFLVWRKLLGVSLIGDLADPLIWLVALGFGLGRLLPPIDGLHYLEFLGAGMISNSVMNSASYEGMAAATGRWKYRRTWEAILNAPMSVADLVVGEWVWAAIKGLISGLAIVFVMLLLGLIQSITALWILPVMMLQGLAFAGMALLIAGLISSHDLQQTYYFSLFLMPMMAISGVFFPTDQLPRAIQVVAQVFPLWHATELSRGIVADARLENVIVHLTVIGLYAAVSISVATRVIRNRLMQ